MQHEEDQSQQEFHEPAPFPPAAEVEQALLGLVHELLNATENVDECANFLGHTADEIGRALQDLHQAVAPNCSPDDLNCILGSFLEKLQ